MSLRIHLTGRTVVIGPGGTLEEDDLPGRQGRLLFTFLVLHGRHPVSRDTLADIVWAGRPPTSWEPLLKSSVSRIRTALRHVGADAVLAGSSGTYQLRLPHDAWVDVEAGVRAVDRAEAALRRRDLGQAWAEAAVASAITRRPLLPHEDADWIDQAAEQLRSGRIRALEVLGQVWLARGDAAQALVTSVEATRLAPLRESAWRLQMRAHAAAGNHAEAMRAYLDCAALLDRELGVGPAAETRDLRAELRRAVDGT